MCPGYEPPPQTQDFFFFFFTFRVFFSVNSTPVSEIVLCVLFHQESMNIPSTHGGYYHLDLFTYH